METPRDPRLRALAHPLRLRILSLVTAAPVSATEVASATGMTNAAASYHLRQLADAGLIERSDESAAKRRAGRPQQRYRMREEPFRDLSGDDSRLLGLALLTELGRRLDTAGPRSTTVDAEVWLRAADRRRLQALVREASELVHERAVPPGTADAAHIGFTTLLLELE